MKWVLSFIILMFVFFNLMAKDITMVKVKNIAAVHTCIYKKDTLYFGWRLSIGNCGRLLIR
jgi:hypothetical protein